MPFTPYHFGPAALLALPAKKYIDIPAFVLANVAVDLEPLTVILLSLNYPLHGFCHTLLIETAVGLLWGLLAHFIKDIFKWPMQLFQLPCKTSLAKMLLSGVLGVWLPNILDSTLYRDIRLLLCLKRTCNRMLTLSIRKSKIRIYRLYASKHSLLANYDMKGNLVCSVLAVMLSLSASRLRISK